MKIINHRKGAFKAGAALQALSLLGAGIVATTAIATPAMAQDYTNVSATGRVVGSDGAAIPNATVVITSDDQGFSRSVTTSDSGSYRVASIPAGSYTFSVSAEGYDTFTESGVQLLQSGAANQFTLAPAGSAQGEGIVVTGSRIQVADFDRNTTGAIIEIGDLSKRVPVERDLTSVILLSPGTSAGDTAFGNLPSINGASVSENVYYINGLNTTAFRNGLGAAPVPFDFYQTVETKTGGIAAEFGRNTGGVINAITKSGSNEYHGSVTFNWEPDFGRSDSPNAYNTDNDSFEIDRTDFIAQLSGPLIKDHLFFYGIYNARNVTSSRGFTGTTSATGTGVNGCVTNPGFCSDFGSLRDANLTTVGTQYIRDTNTSPFYGGKLDAVLGGHRLEATYFNTTGKTNRDTFGTSFYTLASGQRYNPNTNTPGGYVSSNVFRSGGENYVFRYTGSFTDWLTLSAAYGVNENQSTTESNTPNFPSILDQRNGANTGIGNTSANANLSFEKRTFYRADADLNFQLLGSHHVRFGYDREDLELDGNIVANGGFQYTLATAGGAGIDPTTGLATGTNYAIARTFVSGGQFATRNEAYYIQDSWSLLNDRLQLNLGVRNDRFENKNGAGQTFYKSGDLWSPRAGFSFDVFGDSRTKLYGSFSRYYLPIAANTNLRLAGGELDYDAYFVLNGLNPDSTPILGAPITTGAGFEACPPGGPAGTSCVIRNDGSIPGTDTTVASNLTAQSTDEYIIGAEQRLGNGWKVGLYGTYTSLNESLEDGVIDPAVVPLCIAAGNSAADCNSLFNGVHQYVLFNPGSDVTVTLADPFPNETTARVVTLAAADLGYPQAKRTYKAVTFTFDREYDGVWSVGGSYTWSKNRGNIEGGIRSDNGQTDSGLTTAFDLPALVDGAFGNLPNDRRHSFKVYGSYQVTEWLSLGANARVQSQRSFGCIGRAPSSADDTAFAPGGLVGRFYGANAFYCNLDSSGNVVTNPVGFTVINDRFDAVGGQRDSTLQLTPRGSQFKSDWLYNLDLDAQIKLPVDSFDAVLRVSVINVFNSDAELDFNEFGTVGNGNPNAVYGLATGFQAPRSLRLQLRVGF